MVLYIRTATASRAHRIEAVRGGGDDSGDRQTTVNYYRVDVRAHQITAAA